MWPLEKTCTHGGENKEETHFGARQTFENLAGSNHTTKWVRLRHLQDCISTTLGPRWRLVKVKNQNLFHIVLYSFGYQTGRRTGLVLWGKSSLSGKGLGQGFLNAAEMMVLVVFLDSIVF